MTAADRYRVVRGNEAAEKKARKITKPGVYEMPAAEYHADPVEGGSLSSSGARLLMPPSTPAHFAYNREHGRPETKAFTLGHAAHKVVLGAGADLVIVESDAWRTNAAKAAKAEALAEGKIPLLTHEHEQVLTMAEALRKHPTAAKLLDSAAGKAEQVLIWRDERTGVMCRAMVDFLRTSVDGRRLVLPDYKTCEEASHDAFSKSAMSYGYHCQADWYLGGVIALGLDPAPGFLFVAQEKSKPHLVNVIELDAMAMRIGRFLNRQALDIYAACTASGHWPGYGDDIDYVPLPPYYEARYAEEALR